MINPFKLNKQTVDVVDLAASNLKHLMMIELMLAIQTVTAIGFLAYWLLR